MGSFQELTVTYDVETAPEHVAWRVRETLRNGFADIDLDSGAYAAERDGRQPWEDADHELPFVAHDDELAYIYLHTHDTRSFYFFETALVRLAHHFDLTGTVVRFRCDEVEYWGWADLFSVDDGDLTHEREVCYDEDMGASGARAIRELVDDGYRFATYRDLKQPSFRIHTPDEPALDG